MAGEPGFEPGPTESESAVPPLYYSPKDFYINDIETIKILLYLFNPFSVLVYQSNAPLDEAFLNALSDEINNGTPLLKQDITSINIIFNSN